MWYVGTSGWQYASWRGAFYPEGAPTSRWLEAYAERFPTVEVNATFYRLPARSVFAGWARRTPDGFVLTCKLSRYVTHVRRLREPEQAVARFLDRAAPLGQRLGPLLVQLPPDLRLDLGALKAMLAAVPSTLRVAFEPRHGSWFTDGVLHALAQRDAALCLADRRSRPVTPLVRTAGWAYVRLHEGIASPRPGYGDTALRSWVQRVAERWPAGADAYVYFNNDANARAPHDAKRFETLAARAGMAVAPPRHPGPGQH